jgi:hypothetical protein
LPPKQDSELDLEFVLELDLEATDIGRPRARVASSPIAPSSFFDHIAVPKSEPIGDKRVSLIWYRSFALRSAYPEDTEPGESVASPSPGEFVFVFGFDNLWLAVLWLLPILSRCGMVEERQRPVLMRRSH